jgi:hypothetical protein
VLRAVELLPLESERALLCTGRPPSSRALVLARFLLSSEHRLREVSGAAWLALYQLLREHAVVLTLELSAEHVAADRREAA